MVNGSEKVNQHRLFPIYAKEPLLTECQIKKVAEYLTGVKPREAQKNNTKSVTKNNKLFVNSQSKLGKLDAGYTYFGQFIAHEIVPCSNPEPSEHNYTTTPELDLKSLYGEPSQYSMLFDDKGKFRVSDNRPYDVIRDENGRALIPDQRNDENAIILQFHVLWQKIHNKIIDLISPGIDEKCKLNSVATHNEARKITTALFQYLTIYDFAARIIHPKVFEIYFNDYFKSSSQKSRDLRIETKEYILKDNSKLAAIPVEFSHAVYRFGHSMVRAAYNLDVIKDHERRTDLMSLFRGNSQIPLHENFRIGNWLAFFNKEGSQVTTQEANSIDLFVTTPMAHIPVRQHIVQLNLTAGKTMSIPSGHCIKKWIKKYKPSLFKDSKLTWSEPSTGRLGELDDYYNHPKIKECYDKKNVPLWLYTLEESTQDNPPSKKLGRLTSIIVTEVLRQSILSEQLQSDSSASFENILINLIKNIDSLFAKWRSNNKPTISSLLTYLNLEENTVSKSKLPKYWETTDSWVNFVNTNGGDQDLIDYHPRVVRPRTDNGAFLVSSEKDTDTNGDEFLKLKVKSSPDMNIRGGIWRKKTQKIYNASPLYLNKENDSEVNACRIKIPDGGVSVYTHVTLSVNYNAKTNEFTTSKLWEEISSEEESKVLQSKTTSYTWIR